MERCLKAWTEKNEGKDSNKEFHSDFSSSYNDSTNRALSLKPQQHNKSLLGRTNTQRNGI